MSRLVTFGCSYTWGQGFDDCPWGSSTPSKFAWPAELSEKMNLKLVNYGNPGASNLEILLRVLHSNLKQTDTVIILWTYCHRGLVFTDQYYENSWKYKKINNTTFKRFAPWLDENTNSTEFKEFFKVHNMLDLTNQTWLHIQHANLYLNSLGINSYHYTVEDISPPEFIKIKNASYTNFDFLNPVDYAADNTHPGVESQKKIANYIYDSINQK